MAQRVATHLAAVTRDLEKLEPPVGDEAAVRKHYLEPLRGASEVLTEVASRVPLGSRFSETAAMLDSKIGLFSDADDYEFVVGYGLRQWWDGRNDEGAPSP